MTSGVACCRAAVLHAEAALHKAVAQLAARFSALVGNALGKKWYQHFEAWLCGRRAPSADPQLTHAEAHKRKRASSADSHAWEVVLPTTDSAATAAADAELQRKLLAAGAAPAHVAAVLAELRALPASLLHRAQATLSAPPRPKVKVTPFQGQKGEVPKLKLSCLGASVEVNKSHFDKLRVLYSLAAGADAGRFDATAFTHAAMAVLLRYSSLQGTHHRAGGFQVCFAAVA